MMRRAMSPTICTTWILSPKAVSSVTVQRAFSRSALRSNAARARPALRSTETTRPASGQRLTCTSNTDRKIPMRCALVPSSNSISPASSTRPSAGDTTVRWSPGISRGGFRKKKATNTVTPISA
jgi:hypothetical protein